MSLPGFIIGNGRGLGGRVVARRRSTNCRYSRSERTAAKSGSDSIQPTSVSPRRLAEGQLVLLGAQPLLVDRPILELTLGFELAQDGHPPPEIAGRLGVRARLHFRPPRGAVRRGQVGLRLDVLRVGSCQPLEV